MNAPHMGPKICWAGACARVKRTRIKRYLIPVLLQKLLEGHLHDWRFDELKQRQWIDIWKMMSQSHRRKREWSCPGLEALNLPLESGLFEITEGEGGESLSLSEASRSPNPYSPVNTLITTTTATNTQPNPSQKRPTPTILSIGCGNGLSEALLQDQLPSADVIGVEVQSATVRYLDEHHVRLVRGTWDIAAEAEDVDVWVWVYPREPRLVRAYLEKFGLATVTTTRTTSTAPPGSAEMDAGPTPTSTPTNRPRVWRLVWLGPRVDWEDYEPVLRASVFGDHVEVFCGSEGGLAAEEMMAVETISDDHVEI
ncbi:Uu.00g116460.m01.CDS01 [Anthostomella pinea]|uniref:Uu.00g116460.m01.CDS01 n=1 Tax=Anthostomella pinea TaxID=933095 RepID=A0AAI8VAT9_9PEZI|nr:Uu.00g116460.m01.CDS01 [Anthostomella pinea]